MVTYKARIMLHDPDPNRSQTRRRQVKDHMLNNAQQCSTMLNNAQQCSTMLNKVRTKVVVIDVGEFGERSLRWIDSEMGRIGNTRLRTSVSGRLFVSAILSLISILISPVLSTDAMWNVITDATGTGLETS